MSRSPWKADLGAFCALRAAVGDVLHGVEIGDTWLKQKDMDTSRYPVLSGILPPRSRSGNGRHERVSLRIGVIVDSNYMPVMRSHCVAKGI